MKYKWLHEIFVAYIIIKEMKTVSNNLGTFSNTKKETIKHLFLECTHVQNVWRPLQNWISNKCKYLNAIIVASCCNPFNTCIENSKGRIFKKDAFLH